MSRSEYTANLSLRDTRPPLWVESLWAINGNPVWNLAPVRSIPKRPGMFARIAAALF